VADLKRMLGISPYAMHLESYQHIAMAIEMAHNGGTFKTVKIEIGFLENGGKKKGQRMIMDG
jgi:hypothetical protein